VAEEAGAVVYPGELHDLVIGVGKEVAGSHVRTGVRPVFLRHLGKAGERVETVDAAREIDRLEDRGQLRPGHHPETFVDAALDDGALDVQHTLEDLVERDEAREVLAPDVLRKVLDLLFPRRRIAVKARPVPGRLLLLGLRPQSGRNRRGVLVLHLLP
jgi:hypothetical protein